MGGHVSEPLYKSQKNKRTGAIRQLVSHDDGATWTVQSQRGGAAEPIDESPDVAAPPEVVRRRQAEYEAEHPDEVPGLRKLGFSAPDGAAMEPDPRGPPPWVLQRQQEDVPAAAPRAPAPAPMRAGVQQMPLRAQPPPAPLSAGVAQQPTGDGRMSTSEARSIGARNPWEMGGEASGLGAWIAAKLGGEAPRTTARGVNAPLDPRSEYEVGRDLAQAEQARALRERPDEYQAAQTTQELLAAAPTMFVAPFAAPAAAVGAGGVAAAPTLGRMVLANAGQAGAAGALRGGGAAEPGEVGTGALRGAAIEGSIGAALAGGPAAIARGAPGLAKMAGKAADRWRAAASGAYGGEMSKLAERYGDDYAEQLGRAIERMGLHERRDIVPIAAPAVGTVGGAVVGAAKSDDPSLTGKAVDALKGAAVGGLAGAALGRVSTPAVYRENAARAAKELGTELSGAIREATEQGVSFPKEELLERMRGVLRNYSTKTPEGRAMRTRARELMTTVREKYGEHLSPAQLQRLKKSYEAPEAGGFEPTKNMPRSEANTAKMYQRVAGAPRSALDESIAEQALPETAAKFSQARDDFGIAKKVENMARKRVAQEAGNQPIGLASTATGDPLGAASVETIKRVGRDLGADVLRAVERAASPSDAARRALPGSGAVVTTGLRQAPAASPAHAQTPEDKNQTLHARVQQAVASDPEALGPYGAQLAAARTPEDFAVQHASLMATDQDYRRRIRQMSERDQKAQQGGGEPQESEQ